MPEQWAASVRDTLRSSRHERQSTRRQCDVIKHLLHDSSNEIWARFRVASNAINADIDRIQRQRVTTLQQLAQVCSRTLCHPTQVCSSVPSITSHRCVVLPSTTPHRCVVVLSTTSHRCVCVVVYPPPPHTGV